MVLKNKRAAIGFIFITLLLDVTGLGIIIPVLPQLIKELIQGSISEASRYGGWLTMTYALMQFVFAPMLGSLSDKYGRRPIILVSLLGLGIDYVFLIFAPTIAWLFVGRAIAGLCGASFTTASAYIADISDDTNRAQNFGMIGAAFGLGFILGPTLGGLLGSFGSRVPFIVAAALSFLNWLYGFFVLPESLPLEERRPFSWSSAIPGKSLIKIKKFPAISGLLISFFLIYLASHAVQSNWNFFTIEKFGWSEAMIGLSLGLVGLLVGGVQGGLVRYINPRIGNEKSVYYGLALYALGLFLFSIASQGWMMFVFLIPYCLGGIAGPALQSIITKAVPRNEQGELQGALTSLISITAIAGPPLMTGLFAYFTKPTAPVHFSGVAFLLGGILMTISAVLAYRTLRGKPATTESVSLDANLPI